MHRPLLPRIASALTLLLTLTACGATPAAPGPAEVTVTALVVTAAPTTAATSTPAPTVVVIAELPDVVEGKKRLADGNFEYAVSLFNKVYGANRSNTEARQLLADAYVQWGRATIKAANGPLDQIASTVALGIDRLNSGQALLAANDPTVAVVAGEVKTASALIELYQQLTALKRQAEQNGDLAQRQSDGDALVARLAELRQQQPNLPGLTALSVDGLLTAAATYEATGKTGTEATAALKTASGYCEQAAQLDPANSAAAECSARIAKRLVVATAVKPISLKVYRINQDDTPSCLSMRISGIRPDGWIFSIDGIGNTGVFDGAGNARLCGLSDRQQVTFTVKYPNGAVVPGGGGIPAQGGDIFGGEWR